MGVRRSEMNGTSVDCAIAPTDRKSPRKARASAPALVGRRLSPRSPDEPFPVPPVFRILPLLQRCHRIHRSRCQQTLCLHLLATSLTAPSRRELVTRADLETFVHLGDLISHYESVETRYAITMPKSIEQHARLIDEWPDGFFVPVRVRFTHGGTHVGQFTKVQRTNKKSPAESGARPDSLVPTGVRKGENTQRRRNMP
jgi:hypothetical protein